MEPTTACNLGCPECPSGLKKFTRPTGKMELVRHEKWLKELSKTVFYVTYYFQGEPFLNPQLLEMIKAAKRYRMYTATSTNAHFITRDNAEEVVKSGLDQLIISVDGVSQEVYEQYRVHGDLEKVWRATEALVEAKQKLNSSTPKLIFQCLAVKPNEHEIPLVFEKAKTLGVDEVRIKSAQLYDYKHGNPLMPDNEEYSRYKQTRQGEFVLKNTGGNHCWRMWSGSVVTWDGKVVPCCFDKDAAHAMGELTKDSFNKIWRNPSYQAFRTGILKNRQGIDICQNCTEGTKVWL
jgi:radical SAM protein with 4Fe4S-binding SPASM domain